MLPYPATIPLSSRTLHDLADRIRRHRRQRRSRWRRLDPARQALLALAHLRNGDTYTRLAAGFGTALPAAIGGRPLQPTRVGVQFVHCRSLDAAARRPG